MELDAKKLRRAMAAKDYTVKGLAKAAGVSAGSVNMWLNHGVRPRLDTVGKLSRALGVDICDIVKE